MSVSQRITSTRDERLSELCHRLADLAGERHEDDWPGHELDLCADFGVFEWFLPCESGGQHWDEVEIVKGYLSLSAACLTTTFIVTQRMGACRRIAVSENLPLKQRLLPDLVTGQTFTTVGISHLTTSHRHVGRPVLSAQTTRSGFILDGFSPWVTGAEMADTIVLGATLEDGRDLLLAVPNDLPGVSIPAPVRLIGLSGSKTGKVTLDRVEVDRQWLISGPVENIMQGGSGAMTGGLQTSTLAVGLATSAIDFLLAQTEMRPDLCEPADHLRSELHQMEKDLISVAQGEAVCTNQQIRTRANSLVLRATQAALTAAKGAGYVEGHPVGRWCREALFFLVWSCPQPVLTANLCELAGITD